MRRTFMLISAAVLSMIAGVQTAMAQKVTLYMADNQTYECDIARLDSIVFSEGQTIIPDEEIVVTVDAYGNADGGHQFTRIDEATFLIDDIKYRYENGSLLVSGYDPVFFAGTAKIISKLIYNGRAMNVVGIGNGAFDGCSSLTSITIPESVTSIGNSAFYGCSNLTSITIPKSVTSIGGSAFYGCTSLTSITIPNSVTSIDRYAFSGCSGLTSVTIPNSVTSIGSYAFQNCTGLTSITIPESVTYISSYAFQNCTGLTSITIPESVTSIGWVAFSGCSSLTSVTIPNSVTSIGDSAFSGCSSLTSVTIPESVTSIGNYAFQNCTGLTSITIPESVTSIGNSAFYGCFFKTDFFVNNSSLTSDNNWGATLYDEERSDGLIIINNIVVGCRPWAVSITIPNNVTSIGQEAFSGCSSLTSIIVDSGNTVYDSRNNCNAIIETETNTLIAGCKNTIIPESVTSIGIGAFCGCSSLTSITIPSSVTSIGSYAFYGCRGLTSITIPNSVTSIGGWAFAYCQSLTDVYCYAENVPSTISNAFEYSSISSATLHVPAGSVNSYKPESPWSSFGSIVAIE